MAEVDKAVQKLQDMWYLAAVNGLGLDKSSFMLLQSGTALPYTTGELWQMIDAIPPKALTTVLSLGALNSFYQNYGGMFSAVIAPVTDNFKRIMGDNLTKWMDYKKSLPDDVFDDTDKEIKAFTNWAKRELPNNVATTAITIFGKEVLNIVNMSREKYRNNSDASHPFTGKKGPLYRNSIDDITGGAIASGPTKTIHVDSNTSSSDVSNTWAKGGVSGFFSIFALGGSGSYSKTTSKIASSQITIDATFKHVFTLQTFKPGDWFDSAFMNYARSGENVWSVGNPMTWANTFGPDGNMKRIIEQLVIVDGIEIVMTSNAVYSTDEQMEITNQAKGGMWPFFFANSSGGQSSRVKFNDQGRMTVTTSCPTGRPAIFGANVREIKEYFKLKS